MYSKKSWGGNVEPFILVKFLKADQNDEAPDPIVSIVIWEWKDSNLIGKPTDAPRDDVWLYALRVMARLITLV